MDGRRRGGSDRAGERDEMAGAADPGKKPGGNTMDGWEALMGDYRESRDKLWQAINAGEGPDVVKALQEDAEKKWAALRRAIKERRR